MEDEFKNTREQLLEDAKNALEGCCDDKGVPDDYSFF